MTPHTASIGGVEIKPGDTVKHRPSGEEWIVAAINYDGDKLAACGWPETIAYISDCDLVESSSEEESNNIIERCLKIGGVRQWWNESMRLKAGATT